MKMKISYKKVGKSVQSDYFCNMKIKIFATALIVAALIISCNSEHKNQYNSFEEEQEDLLPYGVTDTINGEKVSKECALMNSDLEWLLRKVERVKSPDMLMLVRKDFEHTLDSLTIGSGNLVSEERTVINNICDSIRIAYAQACEEYEIPAEGVIDNLKHCITRVDQAKNSMQLELFIESRRGMLRNLDYIHLCVESKSKKIPEVKRLAQQLKSSLETKKKQFNIKD